MKIFFPVIRASSGGDVFIRRLSNALNKEGIQTEIQWFHKYYEFLPHLLKQAQIPADADIIHTNSWGGFAFKRRGIPLVVTEYHCVFDPLFRPFKSLAQHLYHNLVIKKYELASFAKADSITAISKFTQKSLERCAGLSNVKMLYLWVETDKFTPPPNNKLPERTPFQLLYVGNLSKRKGVDLLGPIMKKLGENFELRMTTGLRNTSADQFPKNIIPLGKLSEQELIQAYQKCDALLFPSRFEGFGYSPLEAMACGKPVVASETTSIPEVIEKNTTGLLCPTNDIDAFVMACRHLAGDRDLCQRLGNAGRKRAVEYFGEKKIITQYIEHYKSLIEKA